MAHFTWLCTNSVLSTSFVILEKFSKKKLIEKNILFTQWCVVREIKFADFQESPSLGQAAYSGE